MMVFPPEIVSKLQQLRVQHSWAWCVKLTVDMTTTATTVIRIVNQRQTMTIWEPQGSLPPLQKTFRPYPCGHDGITTDGEGGVPTLGLGVIDVAGMMSKALFRGQGLTGLPASVYLVHEEHLDIPEAVVEFGFEVGDASVQNGVVSLQLQPRHPGQIQVPQQRFSRKLCQHPEFGDPDTCAYPLTAGGPTECDRRLPTCTQYGLLAEALGYPPGLYPSMFGGEPGIEERSVA